MGGIFLEFDWHSNNQVFLPCSISGIMIFREATREDWPAISDISRRSGYEDYINRLGPSYLDEGTVLIAEDGVPVGFSKVEMMADGATWLSGLRVDPDHWRRGIGSQLTRNGVDISRRMGAYAARMLVEASNYRSRALSEKMLFREAESCRFYEQGVDLDGYSEARFKDSTYVAAGWKFMRADRAPDIPGRFFSNGPNLVFAADDGRSFHVLSSGEPVKPADEGMTICSSGIREDLFARLRRMEDFPAAIVYEMIL